MPDLTYEQYKIIREELSKSTATQFVKVLLNEYSNNLDNLSVLLSYIPQLADKVVQTKQNVINRYSWATDLLLGERYSHPVGTRKARRGAKQSDQFPILLYTCLVHIPNGNIEGQSVSVKAFFDEFVDAIRNKRGFDYESAKDWRWLRDVAGGDELVEKVVKDYIDKDFVLPNNMKEERI